MVLTQRLSRRCLITKITSEMDSLPSTKKDLIEVSRPFAFFFNMAASGYFGVLAQSKFSLISQTGVGISFVTNTLKYQNQPLNNTSLRLVSESMIFTLLNL